MFPTKEWVDKFVGFLNQDDELKLYGKHFNLSFAIETDGFQYNFVVNNGNFSLAENRSQTDPQLTLRTSSQHWKNFASSVPVPTYTDLFGAAAYSNIEIEGDVQHIWANIRCLWRTMEIMRKVGESA